MIGWQPLGGSAAPPRRGSWENNGVHATEVSSIHVFMRQKKTPVSAAITGHMRRSVTFSIPTPGSSSDLIGVA